MTSDIIGIDLGTTHTCVAIYENGNTEILANQLGTRTTPSWVAWNKEGQAVGEPAKDQAVFDPLNTVYDIKRMIGREYNDTTMENNIKHWPFTVICSEDGLPIVKVEWNGKIRQLKPEEISAIVLKEQKSIAELYLDKEVTKAVVTVPAYFNLSQRKATMEAGKIAGLEIVRLLNEPTAAALAYAVKKNDVRGNVLVFDLGGGTLDVSIVTIKDSHFQVKATKGNTHLGGQDFTYRLFDYIVRALRNESGVSTINNVKAFARLMQECEIVKQRLSYLPKVKIYIQNFVDGKDFVEEMTRDTFYEINADLFDSVLEPIVDALDAARLTKADIDKVVMVGGSSRIPQIKNKLQDFFVNKDILTSINPDEAIAAGAAIYAAIYDGIQIENRSNFTIEDIIPRSLGIAYGKDSKKTTFAIKKNSIIPISRKRTFYTSVDNQTIAKFSIYEGDSSRTDKNMFLGEFTITEIPPAPAGTEEFIVTFTIDSNGLLKVSAINISTGNERVMTIRRRMGSKYD